MAKVIIDQYKRRGFFSNLAPPSHRDADMRGFQRWCIIHAVIVVAQTPLAFVPGPNFLAYYFIFLSVGHYFSMRGAQRGRERAMWTTHASASLQTLSDALALPEQEREARIAAAARELGLERLQEFVRRVMPADAGRS